MLTPLLLSGAGFNRLTTDEATTAPKLDRGRLLKRRVGNHLRQSYYLYVPRSAGKGAPLLVSVHGISRNARQHAEMLSSMAEAYGVILVAPLFTRKRFPDYQRLGRLGRGPRADLALDRIVGDVLYRTGADTGKLYLFGYSGGGQFVHRYAMAHPERVAGVVIGAAGWYTFPDSNTSYPRGTAAVRSLSGLRFDQRRFLHIPMTVLVGGRDVERDPELNKSPRIDLQQGLNRVQRACNWIESMNQAAQALAIPARHRIELLPGIHHSFEQAVDQGKLDMKIFSSLFGPQQRVGQDNLIRIGQDSLLADSPSFIAS